MIIREEMLKIGKWTSWCFLFSCNTQLSARDQTY